MTGLNAHGLSLRSTEKQTGGRGRKRLRGSSRLAPHANYYKKVDYQQSRTNKVVVSLQHIYPFKIILDRSCGAIPELGHRFRPMSMCSMGVIQWPVFCAQLSVDNKYAFAAQ